ncbi:purine nucleoside permease, partial [Acaromyces ingoldii]
ALGLFFLSALALAQPHVIAGGSSDGQQAVARSSRTVKPRLLLITMFTLERNVWLSRWPGLLAHNITIPGLSPLFPHVHCESSGRVCLITTGEGQINAASTMTSLFFTSSHYGLDLRSSYLFVTGIAGVDPRHATLGSAAFARYAVQVEQQYALSQNEVPDNFTSDVWSYGTTQPGEFPTEVYGTEVYSLNHPLAHAAYALASKQTLNDSSTAKAYRAQFTAANDTKLGAEGPKALLGDVATSDLYFAGRRYSDDFALTTATLTNGSATMVMSAQEDNATLEALLRAHRAGLADYARALVLRTASDILFAPPNLSEYAGFEATQGGLQPSLDNIYIAAKPFVDSLLDDGQWRAKWAKGITPQRRGLGDIYG